jgi:hypothetical protein
MSKVIKDLTILSSIGRKYNLIFSRTYKYCETGPYKNEVGETIPNYLPHVVNGVVKAVYELEYFDGCFNPYLVEVDMTQYNHKTDHIRKQCNHIIGEDLFYLPE